MKRELWLLGGLFVVSYGVLLGLTWDEHQPDAAGTVAGAEPPLAPTTAAERIVLAEALSAPSAPDRMARLVANEPLPEEGISSGEVSEGDSAPPVMQSAISSEADELLRRASSPEAAIQALSHALQPSSDRETRLAAVNALLVIGRKSTVDPTVVSMLKQAVNDTDSTVAAEASSALQEVERAMH